jgi:PAS domain S-box-containing protein
MSDREQRRAALEQRVAEAEAALQALVSGSVDAVMDPVSSSPILLREAQAALRRSEESYGRIVEAAQEGIWIIDSAMTTTFVNEHMAQMLGYTIAEFMGARLSKFMDEAAGGMAAKHIEAAKHGVREPLEFRFLHKDGSEVWALLAQTALYSEAGVYEGGLAMVMDITGRKRGEEAIRRLAAIVESSQDAIISKSLDGVVLSWNPAAERLYGFTTEEAIGKHISLLHHHDLGDDDPSVMERIRRGVAIDQVEIEFARKDGSLVLVSQTISPIRDSLDRVCAASVIARDITQRKRDLILAKANEVASANELLRELAEEKRLAQVKFQELARDLALSKAESANRAKSAFLANMSHELRTPLNAIIGFSQMLEDRLFGELNAKQGKQVNHILVGGRHLLKLINEILDLSTIEAGKVQLEFGPVDLHVIASEVLDTMSALAAEKKLGISISVPSLRFIADSGRVRQILLNLVANAIKFTPAGGGGVEIRANMMEDERGRFIRIAVRDTGIGIKREDIDRLFVEFGRLDDTYARTTEGSGLGLALTKRLVELHGGTIHAFSAGSDAGSTFTVELPEVQAKQRPSDPIPALLLTESKPAAPIRTSRGLILVVDDEISAQEMLFDVLTLGRYEVIVVADVEQAIAHVQQRPPMAVILDINLPGGRSGWAFLESMQASPHTRNIPVIVLSILDERARARSLGASEVLLKPLDRERLLTILETAGRRQRTNRTALVVDADPMVVKFLSFALRERGWNVLTATSGDEAFRLAEHNAPDIAIVPQTLPDSTGVDLIERLSLVPAMARMPVLVHADQPLDNSDLARLDPERHAVVKKLQSDALLAEVERLCDGFSSSTAVPPPRGDS